MRELLLAMPLLVAACAAATAQEAPPPADGPSDPSGAAQTRLAYVGRVVDADGRPVAGAVVLADNGGSYQSIQVIDEVPWRDLAAAPLSSADVGPFTVRGREPSGADGRFRVEGVSPPAGKGWVIAFAEGYVATRKDLAGVGAAGGVVAAGDVVLARGCDVRVTVRRADGKPAIGASVVARPRRGDGPRADVAVGDPEGPGEVRAARTGDDGTCVVRGLRAAPYRIGAFDAGTLVSVAEVAAARDATREVSIDLTAGAVLTVVVTTRGTDAPVEGARVIVDRLEAGTSWPGPAPLGRGTTDAGGRLVVVGLEPLPEMRVSIVPPDFAADAVNHPGPFSVVSVVKPGDTVRVALPSPCPFVLPVVDAVTHEPIADARATLRADWKRWDHTGGSPIDLAAVFDEKRRALVALGARPGPWAVDVWAPGHLPRRFPAIDHAAGGLHDDARDGTSHEAVTLERATAVASGRIVAKTTGDGVAGAVVASYEWIQFLGGGQRAEAKSSSDGAFRLEGLLGAGFPIRLEISAPGFVPQVREFPAEARAADLGAIEIVRSATIRGRVTDAAGRPVARVGVDLVECDFPHHGKGDGWTAVTDDEGRFAFRDLRPGEYVIVGEPASSAIRLAEGEEVVRDLVR